MLQIITGKFFGSPERHVREQRGVLYSNYHWIGPIDTCVGKFEPIDFVAPQTTFLFSFTNQIEKRENDVLITVGQEEILDQFRLLAVFGLKAVFAKERAWVQQQCRSVNEWHDAPAGLLPRFFEPRLHGSAEECKAFPEFVAKVLGLGRKEYRSVMTALHAFDGALNVMGTNLDLAYSMMVYALESLAQRHLTYVPKWEDYEEGARKKLDGLLAGAPAETAEGIRATLVEQAHLKARVRFQAFITSHLNLEYFTTESAGLQGPLRRSELERALQNLYATRSKYVHELKPLMRHLSVPQIASGDVSRWEGEPHFTFAGMVRLVQTVVHSLVQKLPGVEREDYNWRAELPGILHARVAPQYWVHNAAGYTAKKASDYYWGFLSFFIGLKVSEPVCNMQAVLEKVEGLVGVTNEKRGMVALYFLYNGCLMEDLRRPGWEKLIETNDTVFNEPSLEMMSARLALGEDLAHTAEEVVAALREFGAKRFWKEAIDLPPIMETAITIYAANLALRESKPELHRELMRQALLDSPGRVKLQTAIATAINEGAEIPMSEVLVRPT